VGEKKKKRGKRNCAREATKGKVGTPGGKDMASLKAKEKGTLCDEGGEGGIRRFNTEGDRGQR